MSTITTIEESDNILPLEVNLVVEENAIENSLENSLTQERTKIDTHSNPNGANQYDTDPRQELFLSYYFDPKSDTFSNVMQSGIKAGYTKEYSKTILSQEPEWLSKFIRERRKNILHKSEVRLSQLLDSDDEKIVADIAKFNAKTLGREAYNEKTDNTTTIKVESILSEEQLKELLLRRKI